MEEEFRDIKGFEGIYKLSNHGRLKSLARTVKLSNGKVRKLEDKILNGSQSRCKYNYLQYSLYRNNITTQHHAHRLVYEVFVGPIPDDKYVQHIDNNTLNNKVTNLKLVDKSVSIKRNRPSNGVKTKAEVIDNEVVITYIAQYFLNGELIIIHESNNLEESIKHYNEFVNNLK